jgi:opacity protein-like surface antigen
MVSAKFAVLVGLAALSVTAANAADLPAYMPPMKAPPVEESLSGWYLRGDIGMTNQAFGNLWQRLYDDPGTSVEQVGHGFESSMLFGLGIGYKINDWFRIDFTGEYRGKSAFHGTDNVTFTGGVGVDRYIWDKSEWVFMANAYFDLGTWYNITPYIGAGVGGAYITVSGFRDDGFTNIGGVQSNSTAFADDRSKWNLAWALHAGLSYRVTPSMNIDLGYRYINLGSAETGPSRAYDGSFTNGGAFFFNDIYSHDVKLGVRWLLEPPAPRPVMMPLMRRG